MWEEKNAHGATDWKKKKNGNNKFQKKQYIHGASPCKRKSKCKLRQGWMKFDLYMVYCT